VTAGTTCSLEAVRRKQHKAMKLKALPNYEYVTGVYLVGKDTTKDLGHQVYCDHVHLYSFYYTNVTPMKDTDWALRLSAWGFSYTGQAGPGMCVWNPLSFQTSPFLQDNVVPTWGDGSGLYCGYKVNFDWEGDGDVWFEIHSNNALVKAASAFFLVALGALLL